jgi:SAM-dependent methyltransferase
MGGPELSPASNLEWRARTGYIRVVQGVLHEAGVQGGERVLDVGCGTGSVARWLSRFTAGRTPIDALDASPVLLGLARELAQKEGVGDSIRFHLSGAEVLPFPDGHFDVVFSATLLEEVHADRVLAEMVRVTRPGGRVAAVVRAVDLPAWTSLPLSADTRAKVESGEMGGPVGPHGCADGSLTQRLTAAGLEHVWGYPQLGMVSPSMARWSLVEPGIRARLTAAEQEEWAAALSAAAATGTPVWYGPPFHCALGMKPN